MIQKLPLFLLFLLKTSKSFSLVCQHRAGRGSLPIKRHFDRRDGAVAGNRKSYVFSMKLSNLNSREGSYDGKVAERLDVEPPPLRFQIPQSVAITIWICIPDRCFRIIICPLIILFFLMALQLRKLSFLQQMAVVIVYYFVHVTYLSQTSIALPFELSPTHIRDIGLDSLAGILCLFLVGVYHRINRIRMPVLRDIIHPDSVPWRRPRQHPIQSFALISLLFAMYLISGILSPAIITMLNIVAVFLPLTVPIQRYAQHFITIIVVVVIIIALYVLAIIAFIIIVFMIIIALHFITIIVIVVIIIATIIVIIIIIIVIITIIIVVNVIITAVLRWRLLLFYAWL
jgi:hypothetical protein